MDIPLKSQPRVSLHLEHTYGPQPDLRHPRQLARVPTSPQIHPEEDSSKNYKLTRTYSETETNNFDADTGHRLFDDGRIRPRASRAASPNREYKPKLYTRSHDEYIDNDSLALVGLEDEYIPGLDFADILLHWTLESSTPISRDALYLDLNKLHAQVGPQPIFRSKYLKEDKPMKKHKSSPVVDPQTGEINYEAVLASLPPNFTELPYSQRKKVVKLFSELIDYSQFSLFAKNYVGDRFSVSLGRTNRSDNSLRRSRRNSANTVAGRLLALSSLTDLRKISTPKKNADEKGAIVMGHELGKVIGFGAWGTIRECFKDGTVRAVKIVKSVRYGTKVQNPKVLQVFRKEIEIWRQLHHPSILPLLDHVETEEIIFCLTNRIGGGTLFEVVSRWGVFNEGVDSTSGPVAFLVNEQQRRLKSTAEFTRQIVAALLYMHQELGVVHGDLKLENVLVDDSAPVARMILCDFGMSRVYAPRLSRKLSRLMDESTMARSKSSFTERKPYYGPDSQNTRALFADDIKIGVLHFVRSHGPSLQSLALTPTHLTLEDFHEFKTKDNQLSIESDLPHSHIGLLPYASPELLNPLPPPLGPLADIWALGVLMYTMVVGKLPFQHPYEPRLRVIIAAGRYDHHDLRQACLMEWLFTEVVQSSSLVDMARQAQIAELRKTFDEHGPEEFKWVYAMVEGCLERDITKRWDLDMVSRSLEQLH